MAFIDELRSGNGTVYAQWSGLLALLFLVIGGFVNVFSANILFGIIGLVEAFVMLLLEIPIFQKCCPHGENMSAFVKYFEGNWLRAALYTVFATLMWISLKTYGFSLLIIAALFLTFAAFFYIVAGFKKQERQQTALTSGNTMAAASLLV
ncbi:Golgi apparatus membrane protein tvp18 [Sorochytrium milnesiophthora]